MNDRETGVQMAKREFANYSRAQLVEVSVHQLRQGHERTAALSLIAEMDQRERITRDQEEQKRHREIVDATLKAGAKEKTDEKWFKKPLGIFFLAVSGALFVALCKMRWPDIFR